MRGKEIHSLLFSCKTRVLNCTLNKTFYIYHVSIKWDLNFCNLDILCIVVTHFFNHQISWFSIVELLTYIEEVFRVFNSLILHNLFSISVYQYKHTNCFSLIFYICTASRHRWISDIGDQENTRDFRSIFPFA